MRPAARFIAFRSSKAQTATDLMYDVPCDQLADALELLVTYLPR